MAGTMLTLGTLGCGNDPLINWSANHTFKMGKRFALIICCFVPGNFNSFTIL